MQFHYTLEKDIALRHIEAVYWYHPNEDGISTKEQHDAQPEHHLQRIIIPNTIVRALKEL